MTNNEQTTGYGFWTRYLAAFDQVIVLGRVSDEPVDDRWVPVEGPRVSVLAIPNFVGMRSFGAASRKIDELLEHLLDPVERVSFLVRAPTTFGGILIRKLHRRRYPYAMEVIGDPADVFGPGVVRHPIRPLIRRYMVWTMRRQVANAAAVSYVTAEHLQRRYPPAKGVYTTHYSSIQLPVAAFGGPRTWASPPAPLRLVFVGGLSQMYKAPDVMLDAVALVKRAGTDVKLTILGGGAFEGAMKQRADALGIQDVVDFRGQVPSGPTVYAALDEADVFVLPSKAEGLPRAMLEAMARGLPCIGTPVGGIPEVLGSTEMVPPGNADALARKIRELGSDPGRLTALSAHNLRLARAYEHETLQARRTLFYSHIRSLAASAARGCGHSLTT